jgi:hypothetical protein
MAFSNVTFVPSFIKISKILHKLVGESEAEQIYASFPFCVEYGM